MCLQNSIIKSTAREKPENTPHKEPQLETLTVMAGTDAGAPVMLGEPTTGTRTTSNYTLNLQLQSRTRAMREWRDLAVEIAMDVAVEIKIGGRVRTCQGDRYRRRSRQI